MARLSAKDDIGWSARGALRRVLRHDNEEYADRPSTGKKRSRRRGRCRDGHDMQFHHTRTYGGRTTYAINQCTRCGKDEWTRVPVTQLPAIQVKTADEKFFPVHEPGKCPVCDERRKGR